MAISSGEIAVRYAKAAFQYAKNSKQLELWHTALRDLQLVLADARVEDFIKGPALLANKLQFIESVLEDSAIKKAFTNFIKLLLENKRLLFIAQIYNLFCKYKNDYEDVLDVTVTVSQELSQPEQQDLDNKLQQKFARKIVSNYVIDPKILGGMHLQFGDKVIDGSVRGKLMRLYTEILA